eukprot:scaffold1610_cov257-Pinguiococcus_pyrenoidosus.AAC.51
MLAFIPGQERRIHAANVLSVAQIRLRRLQIYRMALPRAFGIHLVRFGGRALSQMPRDGLVGSGGRRGHGLGAVLVAKRRGGRLSARVQRAHGAESRRAETPEGLLRHRRPPESLCAVVKKSISETPQMRGFWAEPRANFFATYSSVLQRDAITQKQGRMNRWESGRKGGNSKITIRGKAVLESWLPLVTWRLDAEA